MHTVSSSISFTTYIIVYNVENHLNRIPCHTCTIKLQIKNMHEMLSMWTLIMVDPERQAYIFFPY